MHLQSLSAHKGLEGIMIFWTRKKVLKTMISIYIVGDYLTQLRLVRGRSERMVAVRESTFSWQWAPCSFKPKWRWSSLHEHLLNFLCKKTYLSLQNCSHQAFPSHLHSPEMRPDICTERLQTHTRDYRHQHARLQKKKKTYTERLQTYTGKLQELGGRTKQDRNTEYRVHIHVRTCTDVDHSHPNTAPPVTSC